MSLSTGDGSSSKKGKLFFKGETASNALGRFKSRENQIKNAAKARPEKQPRADAVRSVRQTAANNCSGSGGSLQVYRREATRKVAGLRSTGKRGNHWVQSSFIDEP